MIGRVAVAGLLAACLLSLGSVYAVTEVRKDVLAARAEEQVMNEQLWLLLMTSLQNQRAIYEQCRPGSRVRF
jgi:hypothetical protein